MLVVLMGAFCTEDEQAQVDGAEVEGEAECGWFVIGGGGKWLLSRVRGAEGGRAGPGGWG